VGGMAAADAAGMAADVAGMVTIDLKSKSPFGRPARYDRFGTPLRRQRSW
jgi:hypothetical protein